MTNIHSNNSKEATHDTTVVWAKSVSEVPGHEVERWGLAVNTWPGFSSRGKTKLAFYQGTLDADSYQNILKNSLLPAAQEWYEDEKGGWELQQDKASCHTAKSTERWLEQHGVAVVEGWPTKGDDINPIENLWAILDERLEDKKFKTEKGMKKKIRHLWNLIRPSYTTSLIPYQTVCGGFGRPRGARAKQSSRRLR